MDPWKLELGLEEEKEPISQTRFSDIDLETALLEAKRLYAKSEDTFDGSTANYFMQKATYYELVSVAKRIGLPVDNPMVIESDRLYARANEYGHHAPTANCIMGKANNNLVKALALYLKDDLFKTFSG